MSRYPYKTYTDRRKISSPFLNPFRRLFSASARGPLSASAPGPLSASAPGPLSASARLNTRAVSLLLVLVLAASLFTACGHAEEPSEVVNGFGMTEAVVKPSSVITGTQAVSPSASEEDNARVFYEVFVGSFSDSNGDGIGDLRGLINRFDYLNDGDPDSGLSLGVEGIWLSPVFKSPSYHKYDVTDYYTIDPEFGTMDDLRELVSLCHERGVKIILDLVINHTGSQNRMFTEFCKARRSGDESSPYYDYYSVNDSIRLGNRTFQNISGTSLCYECNFSADMPELNYDNPAVYDEMLQVASYYLTEIGVDGFRFDAAKYIYYGEEKRNIEFWSRFMADLRELSPNIYAVGEVWDGDSLICSYSSALNCFDFGMSQVSGMISDTAKRGDVNVFTNYVRSFLSRLSDGAMIVPFISNHDMDRAAGYMTLASGYARVAANLYILGPGSPFIYYGEEIGLKGSRGTANTDANRRLAMLWGDGDTVRDPIGTTFAADKQTNGTVLSTIGDASSLYNYYKRLIEIRKAYPAIARGSYTPITFTGTSLGGFVSELNGMTVGVFHNTTGSDITVDLADATDIRFSAVSAVCGLGTATLEGTVLTLSAQTSVVLE